MANAWEWQLEADDNQRDSPDGFPDNMTFAQVNDAMREFMASYAREVQDRSGRISSTGDSDILVVNPAIGFRPLGNGVRISFTLHQTINTNARLRIEASERSHPIVDRNGETIFGTSLVAGQVIDATFNNDQWWVNVDNWRPLQWDPDATVSLTATARSASTTLPEAIGGTGPYTYRVTSSLPTGVTFTGRTITVAANIKGTANISLEAADARNGRARRTIALTYNTQRGLSLSQANVSLRANNTTASVTLSAASGGSGSGYTYSIDRSSHADLTWDATSRRILVLANKNGSLSVTYSVRDSSNNTASDTFTLTYDTRSQLILSQGDVDIFSATARTATLAAASGGSGSITYTLTGRPGAVSFNAGTRVLSITAETFGTAELEYTATDATNASRTVSFDLTWDTRVSPALSQSDITLRADGASASTVLNAATTGKTPISYSLRESDGSSLPSGVSFNTSSRRVTVGANRNGSVEVEYTATTDSGAIAVEVFTITYDTRLGVALSQADVNVSTSGSASVVTLAAATGGTSPYTYSTGNLPNGVTFTASNRQLRVGARIAGTSEITYTATDAEDNTASVTFTLTYNTRAALALSQSNISFNTNNSAKDTVLSAASGGDGNYTYDITSDLPSGVSFLASSRTLRVGSGRSGSASITYRVRDGAGGSTSVTFRLTYNTLPNTTAPGRVSGIAAGTTTTTSIALSWNAPSSGTGTISTYRIQWKTGSQSYGSARETTSSSTRATITGLTRNTSYDFRIRAESNHGSGQWSADFTKSTANVQLYAITRLRELWVIDTDTPANSTKMGDLPTAAGIVGSIASHGGTLYCSGRVGGTPVELWQINPTTPSSSTSLGDIKDGLSAPAFIGGLGSHNNKLYGMDPGLVEYFWEINPTTPTSSTRIGQPPSGVADPSGLASQGGVLYCVDDTNNTLWKINPTTPGRSTKVGNLHSGITTPEGLASHNGKLYCVNLSGATQSLWEINPTTPGSSTKVGDLPETMNSSWGLASHG